MDSLTWLLPLILLWPGIWLLRVVLVARTILGLREKVLRPEVRSPSELPGYFARAAAPLEEFLASVGFEFRELYYSPGSPGPGFESWSPEWTEESQTITATLMRPDALARGGEMCLAFDTTLANGTVIVTTDWTEESLVPVARAVDVEAIPDAPPAALLDRHIQRVEQACAEHATEPLALTAVQAIERTYALQQERRAQAVAKGDVTIAADGTTHWRIGAALRMAPRALRAAKQDKVRMEKNPPASAARRVELSPEDQAEFDLMQLHRMETLRRGRLNGTAKTLLMLGSLLLFVLALGLTLSWPTAFILTGVLIFHECGHLVGMWIFGHRDTQLLFLPFLGGAAVSHDETPLRPWQALVMIFLGPLPGLFLGIAVWAIPMPQWSWWSELGTILVGLNAFNLLPILPLDGGRVFEISVAHRFPRLRLLFIGASGVGLLLLAWALGQAALLGAIGVITLMRLPAEARITGSVRRLRREGPDPESGGEELDRAILGELRAPTWSKVGFTQRLQIAVQLRQLLQTAPGGWGSFFLAGLLYLSPLWLGVPVYVAASRVATADQLETALARAEAAGLFADTFRNHKPVTDAENGAVPLKEALEAFDFKEFNDAQMTDQIWSLVRAATKRPRFEPAAAFKGSIRATWKLSMLTQSVIDRAATLRRNGDSQGALDLLELGLTLHNRVRDSVLLFNYASDLDSGHRLWLELEETLVADPSSLDSDRLQRLAALTDERGVREVLASAMLLNQIDLLRAGLKLPDASGERDFGDTFDEDEEMGRSMRAIMWLYETFLNTDAYLAESIDETLALKDDVERVFAGQWPQIEADDGDDYLTNWNRRQLRQAGDYIARLRLARHAMAFYWQQNATATPPWSPTESIHPVTGQEIEKREAGRFVVLSLRSETTEQPNELVEYMIDETEAELTWRVPQP